MNRSFLSLCGAVCIVSLSAPVFAASRRIAIPGNTPALSSVLRDLDLSETLPNGATLVLRPDRLAPRVAISILVRAGAADETRETAGWRRVLGEAMLRGVQHDGATLTGTALTRAAEALGGRIGVTVGDDAVEVWATGNSENTRQLAALALDVALHPRLSDADIDAARTKTLEAAQDAGDSVATRAVQSLESRLFRDARGEVTAYGLPASGTPGTLAALTGERLRALHTQFFRTSRLIAGAAGDTDAAALRGVLGAGAASSPQDTGTQPFFVRPSRGNPPLVVRQFPSDSAWVVVGFAGAGAASPDAAALRVALAALAESRTARLSARLLKSGDLPERAAGATQVQGQWAPRRHSSEIELFAQTGPQNIEATKNALLDEVRRLREGGLSVRELETAKNYARGSFAVEREPLRERAFSAALWPLLGATSEAEWPARIGAVTAADVKRVAIKYLDAYAVALIMPDTREE